MVNEAGIDGVRSERAAAFAALAQAQLDASYRTAALILRDPRDAEDATHDALVLAWRRWSSLKDPARFDAWFGRILTNVCRDRLRREHRRPIMDISDQLEVMSAGHDIAASVVDRDAVDRGFARLSPEHRIAVVFRYYLDLTVDQIADRTGVPSGTVKSRLHHALRDLGVALEPDRPEEPR